MISNPTERLEQINQRIAQAAKQAGRNPDDIQLIGASKRQSSSLISQFSDAGLRHIGENYLQEAIDKQRSLIGKNISWHFIGQIQSNKTSLIAQHFSWVHAVDRLKIAQRLADAKLKLSISNDSKSNNKLKVLIQLNPDDETSKAGVSLDKAAELCVQLSELDAINLRGFMMIPAPRDSNIEQRSVFARAYELMQLTNQQYGLNMDSLSMGMSSDLEAAILEGSTMVRIGTDLFGART